MKWHKNWKKKTTAHRSGFHKWQNTITKTQGKSNDWWCKYTHVWIRFSTPKMAIKNTCAHNVSVFQMEPIRILDSKRRHILSFFWRNILSLSLLATVSLYEKTKLFLQLNWSEQRIFTNDDPCLISRKQFSILQIMRKRFRTQKKSDFFGAIKWIFLVRLARMFFLIFSLAKTSTAIYRFHLCQ